MLPPPAPFQVPFLENPPDEIWPMRAPTIPPSATIPVEGSGADGITLSVGQKLFSGVAKVSSSPAPDLVVLLDGEATGERSSSCAQTSARAAIHLRASARVVLPWL